MSEIAPESPFGIDYRFYGVGSQDVYFLKQLIQSYPEWTTVIEFGTYLGLTALWMGQILEQQHGRLITIDFHDGRHDQVVQHWLPNMVFYTENLLCSPCNFAVAQLITESHPCLVIMDNGNKPLEVQRYAPFLFPGSAFAVHDFGPTREIGEICPNDLTGLFSRIAFTPILEQEAEKMESRFRCWQRT